MQDGMPGPSRSPSGLLTLNLRTQFKLWALTGPSAAFSPLTRSPPFSLATLQPTPTHLSHAPDTQGACPPGLPCEPHQLWVPKELPPGVWEADCPASRVSCQTSPPSSESGGLTFAMSTRPSRHTPDKREHRDSPHRLRGEGTQRLGPRCDGSTCSRHAEADKGFPPSGKGRKSQGRCDLQVRRGCGFLTDLAARS